MVNLIKINKQGQTFITPYESADAAKEFIKKSVNAPDIHFINMTGYIMVKPADYDTTYFITNEDYVGLTVAVPGGKIMANSSMNPLYPGINMEYADNSEPEDKPHLRPRVLFEKPRETNELAATIWGKRSEEYSYKIKF